MLVGRVASLIDTDSLGTGRAQLQFVVSYISDLVRAHPPLIYMHQAPAVINIKMCYIESRWRLRECLMCRDYFRYCKIVCNGF